MLLDLYKEICTSWRPLVDVRFKLLTLVPTVSLAIMIALLSSDKQRLSSATQTLVALLGLVITIALLIYDRRNSELHDDLISRGRRIEKELGVDTGQFLGRRNPTKKLFMISIEHSSALNGLYGAAILAWIVIILATWTDL